MSTPSAPNHRRAVEAAVKAAGDRLRPSDGPTIELARTLADQMDLAASEPSSRLAASYLSVTKDLRSSLEAAANRPTAASSPTYTVSQMRERHTRRVTA